MFYTTLNLEEALFNGYIGETVVVPQRLANAVRHALGSRMLAPVRMYYYGDRNNIPARLAKMFGYEA